MGLHLTNQTSIRTTGTKTAEDPDALFPLGLHRHVFQIRSYKARHRILLPRAQEHCRPHMCMQETFKLSAIRAALTKVTIRARTNSLQSQLKVEHQNVLSACSL